MERGERSESPGRLGTDFCHQSKTMWFTSDPRGSEYGYHGSNDEALTLSAPKTETVRNVVTCLCRYRTNISLASMHVACDSCQGKTMWRHVLNSFVGAFLAQAGSFPVPCTQVCALAAIADAVVDSGLLLDNLPFSLWRTAISEAVAHAGRLPKIWITGETFFTEPRAARGYK